MFFLKTYIIIFFHEITLLFFSFQYYCEQCWANIHSRPGREFHKPLVKEGADRPRTVPFRWCQGDKLPCVYGNIFLSFKKNLPNFLFCGKKKKKKPGQRFLRQPIFSQKQEIETFLKNLEVLSISFKITIFGSPKNNVKKLLSFANSCHPPLM